MNASATALLGTRALACIFGMQDAAPPVAPPPPVPPPASKQDVDPDEGMRQGRPETEAEPLAGPFAQQPGFALFPKEQPKMMPYLATVNLYGDSCIQKDALISGDPISQAAEDVKKAMAGYGINYVIWQSYNFAAMTQTLPGKKDVLNYYSFDSYLTWNIFQSSELSGTSGWLTIGASAGAGLGYDDDDQTAQKNMGVIGFPLGSDVGQQAYIYQLAWQQSFLDGQLVVTAGMLDLETYMDLNEYANNQYNQLINYEFINPATLPWSYGAMGALVQWQPVDWFYAMLGSAANNTKDGQSPFKDLSFDDWTTTAEFGLITDDMLGLGKAVYRVMPFYGTAKGVSGGGVLFNMEQQLGRNSPAGLFLRAGTTNNALGAVQGASTSVAGGVVLNGPSEWTLLKTQQAYFAAGFYWLEAPYEAVAHQNEYGLEVSYVFQLTETMTLQPDIQVIFDPANNPQSDAVAMFTLQVVYTW